MGIAALCILFTNSVYIPPAHVEEMNSAEVILSVYLMMDQ